MYRTAIERKVDEVHVFLDRLATGQSGLQTADVTSIQRRTQAVRELEITVESGIYDRSPILMFHVQSDRADPMVRSDHLRRMRFQQLYFDFTLVVADSDATQVRDGMR